MSVTLTVARTRVKKYLDDVDGLVADSDTVTDAALEVAQHAVYLQATAWAPQRFQIEGNVTTNGSGVGDLSSLDPVRVLAVNHYSGNSRQPIPAGSFTDGPTNVLAAYTLKILYIPKLTFPATGGDAFVWGQSALDIPLLDDLMCLHAASHLTLLKDAHNRQLERRLEVIENKAKNVLNFSTWKVMPLRGRSGDSGLVYLMTDPVSLQLAVMR